MHTTVTLDVKTFKMLLTEIYFSPRPIQITRLAVLDCVGT